MDERILPYKVGQPIPEWDLGHRLPISKPVSPECKDSSTIFRINSTYMDVTEQPFRDRQWQAGAAICRLRVRADTGNHGKVHLGRYRHLVLG
jgi:hypothetical protein